MPVLRVRVDEEVGGTRKMSFNGIFKLKLPESNRPRRHNLLRGWEEWDGKNWVPASALQTEDIEQEMLADWDRRFILAHGEKEPEPKLIRPAPPPTPKPRVTGKYHRG